MGWFEKKKELDEWEAVQRFANSPMTVKCHACGHKWETQRVDARGVIRPPGIGAHVRSAGVTA